jgi:hypothetical protein
MGNAEETYGSWLEDIGSIPRRTVRARVVDPANGSWIYQSMTVGAAPKGEFEKLLDELDAARAEHARRARRLLTRRRISP